MKCAIPILLACAGLAACEREKREVRSDPIATETTENIALVRLSPGEAGPVEQRSGRGRGYEGNAYHLGEGKRLYTWFNCNGCHANGGGGSGPPHMDDRWIYGATIENIVQTIREGRPNGMPLFRGKVPDDQIWQLAAHVRSMSGQAGKLDLIPGRQNQIQIQADRPGIYRGQCAEYCGSQHVHMGMLVVAEPMQDFERWRDRQVSAALSPSGDEARRGQEIFFTKPCIMCHQIRGTSAGGRVAPDLTHVGRAGARRCRAPGLCGRLVTNTPDNLIRWIVDPRGIDPKTAMPATGIPRTEARDVAAYLYGL